MINSLSFVVLLSLGVQVFAGKEEPAPRLSPEILAALHPKKNTFKHEHKKIEGPQVVATCLNGYNLIKNKCVKTIDEPAISSGQVVTIPYLERCPPEYELVDGGCALTTEVEPEYFCPVGWTDDGSSCAQIAPGETKPLCYEGSLIGGRCVVTEIAKHLITSKCPDGSQVEPDGNCWKLISTFDCTPGPHHHKKKAEMNAVYLRMLGEKDDCDAEPGGCSPPEQTTQQNQGKEAETKNKKHEDGKKKQAVLKEMVSVTAPRPTKVGVSQQLCEKKVQLDPFAIVSCPEGFADAGDQCVRETITSPVNVCVATGSHTGVCPPEERHTPKYAHCPGEVRSKAKAGGTCTVTNVISPLRTCADGFVDIGTGCSKDLEEETFECTAGLKLVGDRCIGESFREPITLTVAATPKCENKY